MSGKQRPPLRALLISDGRPGHYHLAEGVLAAIGRRRSVVTHRLEVNRPRLPSRLSALLLGLGGDPEHVLRLAYKLAPNDLLPQNPATAERGADRRGAVELVVAAGGDTLAALVLSARLLEAPSIFCGTLRHFGPEHISLVVTSYARHAGRPRHLVALKPSPFDPPANVRKSALSGPPRTAGLLIGGNSGLFHYSEAEWARVVDLIMASHAAFGTRWVVSTSRRTDAAVTDRLAAVASAGGGAIQRLIDFRTSGPGTLPGLFAAVDAIVVTEDSSTMLSEAIAAGLPVLGVAPARHGFKDDERDYRTYLRDRGWCRFLPIAMLTPQTFVSALCEVHPMQDSPLEHLADALAGHLPVLFRSGPASIDG